MLSLEGEEKSKPTKKNYKKKGLEHLVIAVVLIAISLIMHSSGIQGGLIFGFISLAWVAFLIAALFYFAKGFIGKS